MKTQPHAKPSDQPQKQAACVVSVVPIEVKMVINVWMINRQMFFLSLITYSFRESDAVARTAAGFIPLK